MQVSNMAKKICSNCGVAWDEEVIRDLLKCPYCGKPNMRRTR